MFYSTMKVLTVLSQFNNQTAQSKRDASDFTTLNSDSWNKHTILKSKKLKNQLQNTLQETCSVENLPYFDELYEILHTPFHLYPSYVVLNRLVRSGDSVFWR